MKAKSIIALILGTTALLLIGACSAIEGKTTVNFSITDAPIDPSSVKAVNIVIDSVSINESATATEGEGSWIQAAIDPPATLNLLDLQNGISGALGSLELDGGTQINQIRLGVVSVVVVETDDSEHEATIPSATGFKIVNAFQIPLSGEIGITVDFDLRKAIVKNMRGYLVKPAVRAVIDNEAGRIAGSIGATGAVAVYAYVGGTYVDAEAVPAADEATFQGAYSSALVKADATYVLAFMESGVYDLYAVDAAGAVVGTLAGVNVIAGSTTAAQNF